MRKKLWNKIKRVMAGVMVAGVLFTAGSRMIGPVGGAMRSDSEPQISVCGELEELVEHTY